MGDAPMDEAPDIIVFGTLEKTAQQADGVALGVAAGNIHKADETEHMELTQASAAAKERHEALLADFESKRRARATAVPTDDREVRVQLRALSHPVTLFGEKQMERRDRLRMLLAQMDAEDGGELPLPSSAELLLEAPGAELFYTEGTLELLTTRTAVMESSLVVAAQRMAAAKRKQESPDEDEAAEEAAGAATAGSLTIECSEMADERPLSGCAFSPDGAELVTCSWSGLCKFWTVDGATKRLVMRAHDERVTGVAFHPKATVTQEAGVYVATASADRTARLWSREGTLLQTLRGHSDRLARLAFHPHVPSLLATCSFDHTWRLWDTNTAQELLCQEGHSAPVYDVAFHCDGSLAATVGLDTHARVWDMRVGRNILTFSGHVKQVLAASFSPNGYHLVTGADDNMAKVWDIRMKKEVYTILAHSNLISQVRFEPVDGHFLLTASYDHTAKVWSARDFTLVKTLAGHENKVMGADIARGGEMVATASYDRTLKLWQQQPAPPDMVDTGFADAAMDG